MKLNEQATLELTASTWLVIAQDGVSKVEALRLLGFKGSTIRCEIKDFIYNCSCCAHVALQGKVPMEYSPSPDLIRECTQVCLLDDLWPKGCEYPTSSFARWKRAYREPQKGVSTL